MASAQPTPLDPTRHQQSRWLADIALAVAALAGTIAMLRHGGLSPFGTDAPSLDVAGIVLAAASTLPIAVSRRSPLGVFIVTSAVSVVLVASGYGLDLLLGPTLALFWVALTRAVPASASSLTIVVGAFLAYLGASGLARAALPGFELLHTGLAWAVAWFAGERTRLRREQLAELKDRAGRIQREAERERRLAVAEERGRISRDLHDSVGHALTVITVRAGAARMRHTPDPQASLAALQDIEQLARATGDEMDQMVRALREPEDPASVDDPSGLASVPGMVDRFSSAGVEITVRTRGDPRPLPHPTDQAAFRIIQESLTNATRHGSGPITLELRFEEVDLEVAVVNPAPERDEDPEERGHGLIGMLERASAVGGRVRTRRSDGYFRVEATLPYEGKRA